jgi:SAM-dependent methyltransferase
MDNAKNWEGTYRYEGKVWGEEPSELARFTLDCLNKKPLPEEPKILDLGCGYGRDSAFLCRRLSSRVIGIDSSPQAIIMARGMPSTGLPGILDFFCGDFGTAAGQYQLVFASNFYQILPPGERARLRETIRRCLAPGGLLFLNSLAVGDPQHFGKGEAVVGEANSFIDSKYLHFCTEAELRQDFGFLNLEGLELRE